MCMIEIGASIGRYSGMPEERDYTVVMGGLDRVPSSVVLEGVGKLQCTDDSDTREASFVVPTMGI